MNEKRVGGDGAGRETIERNRRKREGREESTRAKARANCVGFGCSMDLVFGYQEGKVQNAEVAGGCE